MGSERRRSPGEPQRARRADSGVRTPAKSLRVDRGELLDAQAAANPCSQILRVMNHAARMICSSQRPRNKAKAVITVKVTLSRASLDAYREDFGITRKEFTIIGPTPVDRLAARLKSFIAARRAAAASLQSCSIRPPPMSRSNRRRLQGGSQTPCSASNRLGQRPP
jgi:hypothetical protein